MVEYSSFDEFWDDAVKNVNAPLQYGGIYTGKLAAKVAWNCQQHKIDQLKKELEELEGNFKALGEYD